MGLFFIVKDDTYVPCKPPASLDTTAISKELVYQECNDVDLQYSLHSTPAGVTLRVRGKDLAESIALPPNDYANQDFFILIEPNGVQKIQVKTVTQMNAEVSTLAGVVPNLKSYHERFWNILSTEKYATETLLYTLVSKLRANPTELSAINVEKENLLKRLDDLEQSLTSLSLQLGKTPLLSSRGEILYLFEKYAPQAVKEPLPPPEPAKEAPPPSNKSRPTSNDAIRKHTEALSLQRQIYETIIALNQLNGPSEAATIATLRTKAQDLLVALDRAEKELKILHEQLSTPAPTAMHLEIKAQFEQAAQRAATRTQAIAGREVTQAPTVAQPNKVEPNPEEEPIAKDPSPEDKAILEKIRNVLPIYEEVQKISAKALQAVKVHLTPRKIKLQGKEYNIVMQHEALPFIENPKAYSPELAKQLIAQLQAKLPILEEHVKYLEGLKARPEITTWQTELSQTITWARLLIDQANKNIAAAEAAKEQTLAKVRQQAESIAEKVSEDGQELIDRSGNILDERNRKTLESFAGELQTAIGNARKELPKIAKLGLSDAKIKNAYDRVDGTIKQLETAHKDITTAAAKLPKPGEVAGQPTTFTDRTLTAKDASYEDKAVTYVEFPSNEADWDKPGELQALARFLAHYRMQYPTRKIDIIFYGNKDKFEKAISGAINLANDLLKTKKGKLFTGQEFDIVPYAESDNSGRPFIEFYFADPKIPKLNSTVKEKIEGYDEEKPYYLVLQDLFSEKPPSIRRHDFTQGENETIPIFAAKRALSSVGFDKITTTNNFVAIGFEYNRADKKELTEYGNKIFKALVRLQQQENVKVKGIVYLSTGNEASEKTLWDPLTSRGFPTDGIRRPFGGPLHDNRTQEEKLNPLNPKASYERVLVWFLVDIELDAVTLNPLDRHSVADKQQASKIWFERSHQLINEFFPKK